jgi:hypothetical protein
MVLPSMRRFGPLFQPVPEAGVRRVNSISSGSSASLIVSREKCLRRLKRSSKPRNIQLSVPPISSVLGRRL